MGIKIGQQLPSLSRVAVSKTHGEDSPYFAGWKAYDKDPYHQLSNPSGVIQIGLAENQVCCHCQFRFFTSVYILLLIRVHVISCCHHQFRFLLYTKCSVVNPSSRVFFF